MRGTAVRVQPLPLLLGGSTAPLWWGMIMFLIIDAVVYATLLSSYLYLRFHTPVWPPEGVLPPNVLFGGLGAFLLLASAAVVFAAARPLRRSGNTGWLRPGFAIAGLLAVGFLGVQAAELAMSGFRWDAHAYGSLVWTIAAIHGSHVVALATIAAAVAVLAGRGFYSAERSLGIEILALFWYFVALAWLPLVAVLYFVPRAP